MAKYCLKKASKRLTCKKKFKIQHKVREHSRKLCRLSKESERKKKFDKPVSVPNKCPFKEELLMEAEQKRAELKARESERKARQKSAKMNGKKAQQTKRKAKTDDTSIEALAKRANNDEVDYNANRVLAEMLPEINNADVGSAKLVCSFAPRVRHTKTFAKKKQTNKRKNKANVSGAPPDSLSLGEGNVQLNGATIRRALRRSKKSKQKMAKRAEKLAGQLSEQMTF